MDNWLLFQFTKFWFKLKYNTLTHRDRDIPGYHTLILPEPTIRISLLSGFKRIAISPALNENILSDKILTLLFPNFSIFAGLI